VSVFEDLKEEIQDFDKERYFGLVDPSYSEEEKIVEIRNGVEKYFLDKIVLDIAGAEGISKKEHKELVKLLVSHTTRDKKYIEKLLNFEAEVSKNEGLDSYNRKVLELNPDEEELREKIIEVIIDRHNKEKDVKEKTTELIVSYLVNNYSIVCTRNDKQSKTYIYREGIYLSEGKSYIKEFCRKIYQSSYNEIYVGLVISKLEVSTYVDEEDFLNKQNLYPYLVPVGNGLLDVKKKELHGFRSDIPFFTKLNVDYNAERKCPKIKSFIRSLVESDKDVRTLQEFFGYCLVRNNRFEKALMLLDMTQGKGSNGKTTLTVLLKHFLGMDNVASVSLNELEEQEFSKINLHNKMVNIVPDLGQQALSNTNVFRSFTGGDPIMANRKFDTHVSFVNYAKFVYGTNKLPHVYDGIKAFFRRWVIVKFPYRFVGEKDYLYYQKISEDAGLDVSHIKKADRDVLEGLFSADELSGFLNWILEGLSRLLDNGFFTNEKNTSDLELEWTRNSNSLAAFAMDCLESDVDGVVTKKDFRFAYNQYIKRFGLGGVSDRVIKRHLQEEFGVSESRLVTGRDVGDSVRSMCWTGIVFKGGKVDEFGVSRIRVGKDSVVTSEVFSKDLDFDGLEEVDLADWQVWFKEAVDGDGFVELDDFVSEFGEECLEEAINEGLLFEAKAGYLRRI